MKNVFFKKMNRRVALLVVALLVFQTAWSSIPSIYGTGGEYPQDAEEYYFEDEAVDTDEDIDIDDEAVADAEDADGDGKQRR